MYNKPITQRVASIRSKSSIAKQTTETTDTTVLNTIPTVQNTAQIDLPDTTKKVKKEGKVVKASKERCGIEIPMSDPRCVAYSKMSDEDIKASEIKQGLRTPDTEEEQNVPGGTKEVSTPQYTYDTGDSMPAWMQRKVYRGLKVGERQTKKTLKSQLRKGAITKEQYKEGLADAATTRANAAEAFAETQAEAARQGQMFGKKGTTKIGTFDPNVRVSGKDGAVGREKTLADVGSAEQAIQNQKNLQNQIANTAKDNQKAVEQTNAQEDTAKEQINPAAPKLKVGPIKMKTSFKMTGYGSKTYKK